MERAAIVSASDTDLCGRLRVLPAERSWEAFHTTRSPAAAGHLATVFGWAFASVLARLAVEPQAPLVSLIVGAAASAYAGGALLVLVGSRGRHAGWVALVAVAALAWGALGGA